MKNKTRQMIMILLVVPMLFLAACGGNGGTDGTSNESSGQKIVFADAGWDSLRFHNWVARTILQAGYGYETSVTQGSTPVTILGLRKGQIDVYMELWVQNVKDVYHEAIESGDIKKLSVNYDDNHQGFFVPTYVIEGDSERGIKPMAPDLKSVKDLLKYPDVFNEDNSGKARIYGSPLGWAVGKIMKQKVKAYGLDAEYKYFPPGSGTALKTSLISAYENGEPWVGYMWGPTWMLGKFDMTLLKEPPYDPQVWKDSKATAFPKSPVVIAVNSKFAKKDPEVVKFLKQYQTSADLTNEALVYMHKNKASAEEAAHWWMKKHPDLWTKWVPKEIAQKVKKAIQ
ncbi:MAG TPA: ABC transporter substrate-binding protein [Bacillales bacterium]|nr:ABC transporter substrate-binding protein [Bacillales bacterium]